MFMKRIGIIGTNQLATKYEDLLSTCVSLKIIAGKSKVPESTSFKICERKFQEVGRELRLNELDYVFICEASKELEEQIIISTRELNLKIYTKNTLEQMYPLLKICTQQIQNLELILNNIRDGLIVVNEQ